MTALVILAVLFCAMALLGLVRLVRELLVENVFEAPVMTCESAAPAPDTRQESVPQTLSSSH